MIYDKISREDDGLYHVRAFTEDKKKNFIQLNNVKIIDVGDELVFETDSEKINEIHEININNAIENSQAWFGKTLTEKTLRSAYTREDTICAEIIQSTKVFQYDKSVVNIDSIEPGEICSVIVEFAGLWFAKKAFGPSWNLVQVKKHQQEEKFDETYPDEYMFEDD